jgi:hypothetical protein
LPALRAGQRIDAAIVIDDRSQGECLFFTTRAARTFYLYLWIRTTFNHVQFPGSDDIREILVTRVDQQKQAVGIVVGIVEPNGRRVVAYGHPGHGDPRGVDGDTIFEIGSASKVFTSLLLADMVNRSEVRSTIRPATTFPTVSRYPSGAAKPSRCSISARTTPAPEPSHEHQAEGPAESLRRLPRGGFV